MLTTYRILQVWFMTCHEPKSISQAWKDRPFRPSSVLSSNWTRSSLSPQHVGGQQAATSRLLHLARMVTKQLSTPKHWNYMKLFCTQKNIKISPKKSKAFSGEGLLLAHWPHSMKKYSGTFSPCALTWLWIPTALLEPKQFLLGEVCNPSPPAPYHHTAQLWPTWLDPHTLPGIANWYMCHAQNKNKFCPAARIPLISSVAGVSKPWRKCRSHFDSYWFWMNLSPGFGYWGSVLTSLLSSILLSSSIPDKISPKQTQRLSIDGNSW